MYIYIYIYIYIKTHIYIPDPSFLVHGFLNHEMRCVCAHETNGTPPFKVRYGSMPSFVRSFPSFRLFRFDFDFGVSSRASS